MKKLKVGILCAALGLVGWVLVPVALAQNIPAIPPPPTTPLTKQFLTATTAAEARAYIGITGTNGASETITNLTDTAMGVEIDGTVGSTGSLITLTNSGTDVGLVVSGGLKVGGDVAFDTDGLFFDQSAGRVGIGTASPGSVLDVVGSTEINGTLEIKAAAPLLFWNQTDGNNFNSYVNFESWHLRDNANAELVTVNQGGNVGVGDSTPDYKLDVAGDVGFDGDLTVLGDEITISGTSPQLTLDETDGTNFVTSVNTSIQYWKMNSTSLAALSSSSLSLYTPSGLNVYGATPAVRLNDSDSGLYSVYLKNVDGVFGLYPYTGLPNLTLSQAGDLAVKGSADIGVDLTVLGDGNFEGTLDVGGDVAFDTDGLFFDQSTGNVGIGTASPKRPLHVNFEDANIGIGTPFALSRSTTGTAATGIGAALNFYMEDAGGTLSEAARIVSQFTDVTPGSLDSSLSFDTRNNSGAYQSQMTLSSTGNVGIGDTTPDYKLDVAGDVGFDGDLTVLGAITNSTTINAAGSITSGGVVGGDSIKSTSSEPTAYWEDTDNVEHDYTLIGDAGSPTFKDFEGTTLSSLTADGWNFPDPDSNFTATTLRGAIAELDDANASGPNASDGKVNWAQIVNMPAEFADGSDDGSTGSGYLAITNYTFSPTADTWYSNATENTLYVQASLLEAGGGAGWSFQIDEDDDATADRRVVKDAGGDPLGGFVAPGEQYRWYSTDTTAMSSYGALVTEFQTLAGTVSELSATTINATNVSFPSLTGKATLGTLSDGTVAQGTNYIRLSFDSATDATPSANQDYYFGLPDTGIVSGAATVSTEIPFDGTIIKWGVSISLGTADTAEALVEYTLATGALRTCADAETGILTLDYSDADDAASTNDTFSVTGGEYIVATRKTPAAWDGAPGNLRHKLWAILAFQP